MVANWLTEQGRDYEAFEIKSASSHWLRHTGASQDAENRPIKHLSEDLGHASMSTTDKITFSLMSLPELNQVKREPFDFYFASESLIN